MVEYVHPDFNVTMTLNLLKGKYASIDYTIAAVGKAQNVAKITFFPTKKQAQAPYVDGAINSSPIIADTFFMLPNKPVVNTYAYEGTTNLNVELKTPVQPETPVSYTTWFGTVAETSQLRRSVNQFIDAVRPRPYKPYLHYNSWMDIGFFTTYTEQDVLGRMMNGIRRLLPAAAYLSMLSCWMMAGTIVPADGYLARHSVRVSARSGRKRTACIVPSVYGSHRGAATINRAIFASLMPKSMVLKRSTVNLRSQASLFQELQ